MAEAALEEVIRLADAFRRSSCRDSLCKVDVLEALDVYNSPEPALSIPGLTSYGGEADRIDLRQFRQNDVPVSLEVLSVPEVGVEIVGKRWLLSVVVPRDQDRLNFESSRVKPSTVFSEYESLPSNYTELARQTIIQLLNLLTSDSPQPHAEIEARLSSVSPLIYRAIIPIIGVIFSRVVHQILKRKHADHTTTPPLFIKSCFGILDRALDLKCQISEWIVGCLQLCFEQGMGHSLIDSATFNSMVAKSVSKLVKTIKHDNPDLARHIMQLIAKRVSLASKAIKHKTNRSELSVLFGLLTAFPSCSAKLDEFDSMSIPHSVDSVEQFEVFVLYERIRAIVHGIDRIYH